LVKVGLGRIVRFDGRRPHGGRSPEYPAYLHQRKTVIRKDGCFSLVKVGLGENRRSNKRISFAPAKAPLWRRDGGQRSGRPTQEGELNSNFFAEQTL